MSEASSHDTRIAVCTYSKNAGSTTRAVEIAKAIRDEVVARGGIFVSTCENYESNHEISNSSIFKVTLRFFSHKTPQGEHCYSNLITNAGFHLEFFGFAVEDDFWKALLASERSGGGNFFNSPYQNRPMKHIKSIINAFRDYKPTIILRGLFPEVSIASHILNVKSIAFGPLPMSMNWIVKNILSCQQNVGSNIKKSSKTTNVVTTTSKSSLFKAAVKCGWVPTNSCDESELYEIMKPNLCLVCDLKSNFLGTDFFEDSMEIKIVGPIFATFSEERSTVPEYVTSILQSKESKIFLSMASTGNERVFIECANAVCNYIEEEESFQAIIYAPPDVCHSEKMRQVVSGKLQEKVVVTDHFLPATLLLPKVDLFIGHGGQVSATDYYSFCISMMQALFAKFLTTNNYFWFKLGECSSR